MSEREPATPTSGRPGSERRAERRAAAGFVVCFLAGVGLMIVYASGGQPQLEGSLLAVAFAGLAYGFVTWGNRLMPQGPYVQPRHEMTNPPADEQALEYDLERGGLIERRTLLLRALGLGVVGLGAAAVFPIRSLGPKPGGSLRHTSWKAGVRAVTDDNTPVQVDDVPLGGLVTIFPEGEPGSADGQAILVRVEPGSNRPLSGREDWAPRGLIAYSKVCTHAGCPVGLYLASTHQVLCPCHQSTFDVLQGAKPVFGPAAVALPQLPITIDSSGYVVALGDFSEPVGPYFWSRR